MNDMDNMWFYDANGNQTFRPTHEVVAALLKAMDLLVVLVDGEVVVVTRQSAEFNEGANDEST